MRFASCLAAVTAAAIIGLTGVTTTGALASASGPAAGYRGAAAVKVGPGSQPPGGTQLWAARYEAPGEDDLTAVSFAVSPDGSQVFVTGGTSSPATPNRHVVTVAYSAATGAKLWAVSYYGSGDNSASSVAVSPDGSTVFVTGTTTLAYDAATGAKLWTRPYQNGGAKSLVVSQDGSTVFVTGGVGFDLTVAYDASTGSTLWARHYTGPGDAGTQALSAAVSPNGSTLFVTGTTAYNTGISQYETVAYDAATGAMRWAEVYLSRAGTNVADSVAVSPDGTHVYVTGNSAGVYATIAYDASTGATLWVALYAGPRHGSMAYCLAVSPDGAQVFVTGSSFGGGVDTLYYATVAYNAATGAMDWLQRYPGVSGGFGGDSVAVSPDGTRLFVTGGDVAAIGGSEEYATLAYDTATGARAWVHKYGAMSGESVAVSVKANPDGSKVFVTGYSSGPDEHLDYATVAYSP